MPKLPWTPEKRVRAPHGASSIRVPVPPISRHDFASAPVVEVPGRRKKTLTAASVRIEKDKQAKGIEAKYDQTSEWQREAWAMAGWNVGELGYATNLFANGMSRLVLKPARRLENGTLIEIADLRDEDITENDRLAIKALKDFFYDQPQEEMLAKFGACEFVAGEAVLVGLRRGRRSKRLTDYEWRLYSKDDVRRDDNGLLFVAGDPVDFDSTGLFRIWNPDPQFHKLATSSVRACLPILRELVGLTMYISAQIDSRLAGNGILWVPNTVAALSGGGLEDGDEWDPIQAALIENMSEAIRDRDSASSLVPLIITAPDDSIALIQHMTFANTLDPEAQSLRTELIRRLALGLNLSPDTLLGGSDSSHWAQFWSDESNVRNQLFPAATLLSNTIVREYLQPVLIELGVPEEEAEDYCISIDASRLVYRPNSFEESLQLYKLNLITQATVLNSAGYDLSDAPEVPTDNDVAYQAAMAAVSINPSLYESPGLLNIISQIRAARAGDDASNGPAEAFPPGTVSPGEGGPDPVYNPAQGEAERGRNDDNTGKVAAPDREGTADGRRPRAEGGAGERTSEQRKG